MTTEDPRWLARGFGVATGITRFDRCRNAIEGLDEQGKVVSPGWSDPSVISLAHGEGVRRPHPSVVAAGIRALLDVEESSLDNYLYLRSFTALDEAIAQQFEAEGVPRSEARNVVVESGNSRLFMGFFNAVLEPGDVVLVPRTYYQALNMWIDLARIELQVVPTVAQDDYKLRPGSLDLWWSRHPDLTARVKAMVVFNPGYTGAVYTDEEMRALAVWVEDHDVAVLEDAIFTQTEFPGAGIVHLASMPGMGERVVTVDGGSKAYGLANIRIGWGCGAPRIIERMRHHVTATSICVPHVAKAMALAALQGPADYLEANVAEAVERLALTRGLLDEVNQVVEDELGFRPSVPFFRVLHEPRAGHSVMVSAEGLSGLCTPDGVVIADSVDLTRYFLRDELVCFSPGLANGFDDCSVRISFGCLGSEGTWLDHRPQEGPAALLAVLSQIHSQAKPAELEQLVGSLGALHAASAALSTEGFEVGRNLLREAIGGRVSRAAVRLARENKEILRSRAMAGGAA